MKTQVNKSQLMKKAWNIFKGNNPFNYSFSAALRRAWEVEKENVEYYKRVAEKAEERARWTTINSERNSTKVSHSFSTGILNYYNGAGSENRYFGD